MSHVSGGDATTCHKCNAGITAPMSKRILPTRATHAPSADFGFHCCIGNNRNNRVSALDGLRETTKNRPPYLRSMSYGVIGSVDSTDSISLSLVKTSVFVTESSVSSSGSSIRVEVAVSLSTVSLSMSLLSVSPSASPSP